MKLSHIVIVHEEIFKESLINDYKGATSKIHVIHHGVENFKELPKLTARKNIGINKESDVVLFMGYMANYKGIDLLLEGFAKYSRKNKNAFLVVGAGKHPKLDQDKKYLDNYKLTKEKAKRLINKDQFTWVGFIPEAKIIDYYSAADVTVFPYQISMSSSGPMAFSIGYNKPFLASDVFSKVLNKIFIFNRSPETLEEKLSNFFSDQELYIKSVKAMRKERLWKAIGIKTYQLYS